MTVGLEFSDNVDPAVVVTFALAIAAVIGLVLTRLSLKHTKQEIDLSRKEVEEAHRPVVVPVFDKTFMDLGTDGRFEKAPQLLQTDKLVVPLENVGQGPALNTKMMVAPADAAGNEALGTTAWEASTPGHSALT
jgi:hypothetical protein